MTTRVAILWVCLAVCCQWAFGASVNNLADYPITQAQSVKQFLTADGRFDLEAARLSEYEGALDFSGFAIGFDSRTGEPLFSQVDQEGTLEGDDRDWQRLARPYQQEKDVDTTIRSLAVWPTNLVAGGTLQSAGCTHVSRLASWNGISWDSVGCGLQSGGFLEVYAMTIYAGNLIVGGSFSGVGCWPGIPANNIARWNGSTWSALGSGITGGLPYTAVYALTVYGGRLIAGGNFNLAGGVTANCIAQWDGNSWGNLAQGMGSFFYIPSVYALTVYGSDLVAGGVFDTAGVTPANNIARWNGSTWLVLGSGMNGYISSLTVYGADLVAGGGFTQAGGSSANYIARWNGSTWNALGSGMSGGWITEVSALTIYGSDLIAAGIFTQAGGNLANYIARWNGSTWNALGSGMSGGSYPGVYALTVYNSKLIAGGNFIQAGGIPAHFIAGWDGSSWSRVGYVCGDVNGDGVIDVGDVVYLINYLYKGGPVPSPSKAGDTNCDGIVDIGDVVYLINYLYKAGPAPGC